MGVEQQPTHMEVHHVSPVTGSTMLPHSQHM